MPRASALALVVRYAMASVWMASTWLALGCSSGEGGEDLLTRDASADSDADDNKGDTWDPGDSDPPDPVDLDPPDPDPSGVPAITARLVPGAQWLTRRGELELRVVYAFDEPRPLEAVEAVSLELDGREHLNALRVPAPVPGGLAVGVTFVAHPSARPSSVAVEGVEMNVEEVDYLATLRLVSHVASGVAVDEAEHRRLAQDVSQLFEHYCGLRVEAARFVRGEWEAPEYDEYSFEPDDASTWDALREATGSTWPTLFTPFALELFEHAPASSDAELVIRYVPHLGDGGGAFAIPGYRFPSRDVGGEFVNEDLLLPSDLTYFASTPDLRSVGEQVSDSLEDAARGVVMGADHTRALAHEIGHMFGLAHSHAEVWWDASDGEGLASNFMGGVSECAPSVDCAFITPEQCEVMLFDYPGVLTAHP